MPLQTHPHYQTLLEKAKDSHHNGRSTTGITDTDISHARLYCHAFRIHTIGAFHATRIALENINTINSTRYGDKNDSIIEFINTHDVDIVGLTELNQ